VSSAATTTQREPKRKAFAADRFRFDGIDHHHRLLHTHTISSIKKKDETETQQQQTNEQQPTEGIIPESEILILLFI
jgi:hypothetical protein